MRFSFWPGSGQPFETVKALVLHAEATGWDGIYYADHFMPNGADVSGPLNGAWTTLAALAATVPRVRLGTLVTGNTYRHPAILAKMAASVDQISGGRLILGLGAGWQENEHKAYGLEFSTVRGRLDRLAEALEVITGLFENERTTLAGKHYQLEGAPLEPKPVQNPLPILIGGGGEKILLKLVARYADEWNIWGNVATMKHKMAILDQHCRDLDRDPAEVKRSAVAMLFMSEDKSFLDKIRAGGPDRPIILGTAEEVADTLRAYAEAGVDEIVIPDFNLGDGDKKRERMDRFMNEAVAASGLH